MGNEDEIITPKRHQNHHETLSFQPIPDEIILDILVSLPIRSLLRFKSVCKSWYNLISSPYFVNYHLNSSVTDPYLSRHVIIFKSFTNEDIMSCPLSPVLSNLPTDAVVLNPRLHGVGDVPNNWTTVVDCCNGLVCAFVEKEGEDDRVFLLNPATRKCYELPKPNAEFIHYGFGYDKCSGDYKVVVYDTMVEVYSWRTGSWKRIQDFPGGIPDDSRSKYVNGRLYKFGWRLVSGQRSLILVSLDLATEVFTELPMPTPSLRGCVCIELGALRDRLCVFYNFERSHAEFWVMNEHGAKECWTKLASMSLSINDGWIKSLVPFFIANTREVLMEYNNSCLALYDVKNKSFKHPEIRNVDDLFDANIYVESLVSPRGSNRPEIRQ